MKENVALKAELSGDVLKKEIVDISPDAESFPVNRGQSRRFEFCVRQNVGISREAEYMTI